MTPPLGPGANIVLVGFMGAGKSAVGRIVADRLARTFIDMDTEIERREGRGIPDIFRDAGESYFRTLERALAAELSARKNLVVATGGGIVLHPDNIADFERSGLVVALEVSPEQVLERVKADVRRPLLQTPDKIGRIRELMERRRPQYDAIRFRVDTNGRAPEEVASLVLALFESRTDRAE
jgi:shikimate kinase